VLISRCAWHPRNYGHSKLLGVASWWGLRIEFSDGICRKCAARVHASVRRPAVTGPADPQKSGSASDIVVVALAIMTGLVLVARPANEGSAPVEVVWLPRALTVTEASSAESPPSTVRPPHRTRPARGTPPAGRPPAAAERLQSP
jgi:hypothetical protein